MRFGASGIFFAGIAIACTVAVCQEQPLPVSPRQSVLKADAVEALRAKLIPLAALITPNLPEAAALLDEQLATTESAIADQGKRLLAFGPRAVLLREDRWYWWHPGFNPYGLARGAYSASRDSG